MTKNNQPAIKRFRDTLSGKRLLDKYPLNTSGTWRIQGEDPNCDFNGPHHQPDLGVVEGTLSDVIEYAVDLEHYWTWGSGGDITPITVKKIDSATNKRTTTLRQEAIDLVARLAEINKELGAAQ